MNTSMGTMTPQRRAWKTIKRLLILAVVLVVALPGSAGMLSLEALTAREGPARDLLQMILRLAGRDEVARHDLRGDLDQALSLAETADTRGQEAEAALAREDPFRVLEDRRKWTLAPESVPDSRYVSPANRSLSEAARSLHDAL